MKKLLRISVDQQFTSLAGHPKNGKTVQKIVGSRKRKVLGERFSFVGWVAFGGVIRGALRWRVET
jgi:hypothetical protein